MVDETMHLRHQQAMLTILQEIDRVCTKLQIPYVLFAGSLLGAVRHQGFIPWDDDLDVLMFREDYTRFLQEAPAYLNHDLFYLQPEFGAHWPMFFSKMRLNGTVCIEKYKSKDNQAHCGIYVDIFPCDAAADTVLGRWTQFLASKVVIAKALDDRGYQTNSPFKRLFMLCCRALPMKPFLRMCQSSERNSRFVHTFLAAGKRYQKNIFRRYDLLERTQLMFAGQKYPVPKAYDVVLRRLYGDYRKIPTEKQRTAKVHAVRIELSETSQAAKELCNAETYTKRSRCIR